MLKKLHFSNKIKIILSLFIIYHCSIIFLYPNRLSYLNTLIQPYTLMYANLLGLNRPWFFFSNPAHSVYLKAHILKEGKEIDQYLLPDKKDHYIFRPMFNRRYAVARFFINDNSRNSIEKTFIPWICSLHPEATAITVQLNIIKTPPLQDIKAKMQINPDKKNLDLHLMTKKCTNKVKEFRID